MRNPKRHVRFVLRAVAIGLVVVGAVLMSSWFEVLFQTTVEGAAGGGSSIAASAEALRALPWAVPALLVGLVLLVATRKREQLVSLTSRANDA